MDHIAEGHEIIQGRNRIREPAKSVCGNRDCPLVTKPLPVQMEVRTWQDNTIRVRVRRAPNVEPNEYDHLPDAVLVGELGDVNPPSPNIKQEGLALILRCERDRDGAPGARELPFLFINSILGHGDECIGFGLGEVKLSHNIAPSVSQHTRIADCILSVQPCIGIPENGPQGFLNRSRRTMRTVVRRCSKSWMFWSVDRAISATASRVKKA